MVFVVCAAKVGAAPSLRVFAWFSLAACSAGFKLAHSKSESRLVTANTDTDTDSEYTDNYLCHQNYCINPLFVGLYDLSRLETSSWQCSSRSDVLEYSTFCKDVNTHARRSNRRRELYQRLKGRSYSDQHTLCSLEGFVVSVVDTYTNGTLFIAERTMHIRPRTTAHPCS